MSQYESAKDEERRIDCCIRMKVPNTGRQDLDAIIKEGRRLDFMEKAWCAFNDDPTTADHSHTMTDPQMVRHLWQKVQEWVYEQHPMSEK